jgi:hypothetical protein
MNKETSHLLRTVTPEVISRAYDRISEEIEALEEYDRGEKEYNLTIIRHALN